MVENYICFGGAVRSNILRMFWSRKLAEWFLVLGIFVVVGQDFTLTAGKIGIQCFVLTLLRVLGSNKPSPGVHFMKLKSHFWHSECQNMSI